MRIATSLLYEATFADIQRSQAQMLRAQQELASNRKILSAGDNPADALQIQRMQQAKAENAQYRNSIANAQNQLELVEITLSGMSEVLARARELTVQLGNGTLDQSSRRAIAREVESLLQSLAAQANRRDGEGRSLFAGFQIDQPAVAFNADMGAWQYSGDQQVRSVRISPVRLFPLATTGDQLFFRDGGSVFGTLQRMVDVVDANPGSAPSKEFIGDTLRQLSGYADQLLAERAKVGSRLVELDAARSTLDDSDQSFEMLRSRLQDTDMIDAISRLTRNQAVLQAAQQSFARVQGLDLFRFL